MSGVTRRSGTTVGSGTETTGARRVYAYDNIGNRDTYTKGTGAQTSYETNNLNQYENVETASSPVTGQNMIYDEVGNVTESYVVGDFDGDGSIGFSDLAIFSSSYGYCEGDPEFDERANLVTGDNPECIDAADQSAFMSLFGLSATSVMRAQMLWDAENRLAAYIPLNPSGGAKKVTFKYDYRGRRIEKNVYAWNSGGSAWHTNPTERRRFLWNGWLMLRETIETDSASDGTFEATRVKTYTWGMDLGGDLESAGGIGGLLAVYDDNGASSDLAYVYMYDANGNVGQVCDLTQSTASASIVAKYEYDAYGNTTVSTGAYGSANTYRFSTKPWDDETGLGYWGYRYYDPRLGRWMSRDPIGEMGGLNLYSFAMGDPVSGIDPLGQKPPDDDCKTGIDCEKKYGPCPPPSHYEVWGGACVCTEPTIRTNWGTCKDCDSVCEDSSNDFRDHPVGRTKCENGKPCYCVCGVKIHQRYGGNSPEGAGIVEQCTERHENQHATTKDCDTPRKHSDECNADIVTLNCLREKADHCDDLSGAQRTACYQVLLAHIENASHCKASSGEPPCDETVAKQCRDLKDAVKAELMKRRFHRR